MERLRSEAATRAKVHHSSCYDADDTATTTAAVSGDFAVPVPGRIAEDFLQINQRMYAGNNGRYFYTFLFVQPSRIGVVLSSFMTNRMICQQDQKQSQFSDDRENEGSLILLG